MKISLSSGTLFTFPLKKIFQITNELDFDGIELIINQEFQQVSSIKLIQELQQSLPILSIHAPFMPLDGWGTPIDSLKHSVEIAERCGIPLVNFHPPSWMGFELGFWRWLYKVHDFQKEIGTENVLVTLENMPWVGKFKINPHILSDTSKLIEFIQERNLFMTFDCTHMGSGKANFINDFYLCYNSGRIKNIHFSDYGHGREHLIPGHGMLPLTRFLNHLSNTDYNETVTLELSPHEFPRDEEIIKASLTEILGYLRRETLKEPREPLYSPDYEL
jgi:sugar phosphate isomerase/epimerase